MYYSLKEPRSNPLIEERIMKAIETFRLYCFKANFYLFETGGFDTPKFHALFELGISRYEVGPCRVTETSTKEAKHKEYRK